MRIAISGSHRTGKTTLMELLAEQLPKYESVEEPYHSLEEDGYEFSHPPTREDFVAQLEKSLADLDDAPKNALFDRCPLDMLAYISAVDDDESFDLDEWLPQVQDSIQSLDFIVFVPIEARDRIRFTASDDESENRALVDEKLREILVDDAFELGLEVLVVEGSPEARAQRVLDRMREG